MKTDAEVKGPCRHCGHPSYLDDDKGPAHPCCEHAAREGRKICVGCTNAFNDTAPARPRRKR